METPPNESPIVTNDPPLPELTKKPVIATYPSPQNPRPSCALRLGLAVFVLVDLLILDALSTPSGRRETSNYIALAFFGFGTLLLTLHEIGLWFYLQGERSKSSAGAELPTETTEAPETE